METSMIGAYLYVPGNFNESELLKKFPTDKYNFRKGFKHNDMLYIISQLIEVPYFNSSNRDNEGYVRLKSEMLQDVVPSYNVYLDYLVAAKVISVDKQYFVKEKARGYKFCEPYLSAPDIRQIGIKITDRLYKRIATLKKEVLISQEAKKELLYLTKWINDELTISAEPANNLIRLIHQLRTLEKEYIKKTTIRKLYHGSTSDEVVGLSKTERKKFHNALIPVYEYKMHLFTAMKQIWYAKIDPTVNRFHTNLTNMKSELRLCLRYKGKELVNIDIANSQPYMSILLLHPGFYESENRWADHFTKTGKGKASLHQPFSPSIHIPISSIPNHNIITLQSFKHIHSQLINKPPYNQTIMLLLSANLSEFEEKEQIAASLTDYINHVANGTIYEYIAEKVKERGIQISDERKKIKVMIFQSLFTDNRFFGQEDAAPKRAFAELFPVVNKVFELIKTSANELLPILLQQIESKLFLKHIARRIGEEKPDLPIFTIHDSIMTLKGHEEYVSAVIKDECQKAIGIPPALHTEDLTDNAIQEKIKSLESRINEIQDKLSKL